MNDLERRYLAHHGIKGQKWGVRRFQNPDGSLTAEGKQRLGKLIKLRDDYTKASKKTADSGNKEREYLEKSELRKTKSEKELWQIAQKLYKTDPKYRVLADATYNNSVAQLNLEKMFLKEYSEVSKDYEAGIRKGANVLSKVLDDYGNYQVSLLNKKG